MKNRKIVLIFGLIILFLIAIVPYVEATDNELFQIIDMEEPLNILNNQVNNETNNQVNNEVNNEVNNQIQNEQNNQINNEEENNTITTNNETQNTNTQANNEEGMPQTGVEDTALFVFIAICLASSIYAYTKIRNYRNI